MIAFGVDPGTRKLGWGVVRRDGNRLVHVAHAVVTLDPKRPIAERLVRLSEALDAALLLHRPTVGSVESIFFAKDAQAAAKLGHARGVVLLCLARAGLHVAEYPPARVKQTITGRGQADKQQMAMMVRALLGLAEPPPSDAADALALAITHLRIGPLNDALAAGRRPPHPALLRLSRRR